MPPPDALAAVLLVNLIILSVFLSIAALYFTVAIRDLHTAMHDIRNWLHHLTLTAADIQTTKKMKDDAA